MGQSVGHDRFPWRCEGNLRRSHPMGVHILRKASGASKMPPRGWPRIPDRPRIPEQGSRAGQSGEGSKARALPPAFAGAGSGPAGGLCALDSRHGQSPGLGSSVRSHDAPWRNAGKVVCTPALGGQGIPIRPAWPAHNLPAVFAGAPRCGLPWLLVGHRAFDGKNAEAVVGHDQEEWLGWSNVGHARSWHAAALGETVCYK